MSTITGNSKLSSIGIFGGTFDPIHRGHLRFAQELTDDLGLREIRFIPCFNPPHRSHSEGSAKHRCNMVELAMVDNPKFLLDLSEIERGGISYTVDTLSSLRTTLEKNITLYLLLGVDAFLGLPTWHRWRELFELAHIVVAHRPGFILNVEITSELYPEWQQRHVPTVPNQSKSGHIISRKINALDISSSAIRQAIRQGHSVNHLLPLAVSNYISKHHLYQKETDGT